MSWNSFPGAGHQQGGGGGGYPGQGGGGGGYGYNQGLPPPPPPQWGGPQQGYGYNPPPPPPPGNYNNNYGQGYNPPPPPPPHPSGGGYGGGYGGGGGGGYGDGRGGGGYAPPTGAPPPPQYQQTSAGYRPPGEVQMGNYAPYGPAPVRPPSGNQQYGPQLQGGNGQPARPFFQYSQCTGTRKALCIGINYMGTSSELRGCINDAHNVQKFLIERYNYRTEDIVMLTDDSRNPRQIPTRANMIQAMQWLVNGAKPNDSLFFHYSGHGGQTEDLDGDEDDGYDEVIYPLDHKQAGHIVDDEPTPLWSAHYHPDVVSPPFSTRSCLDLPYIYSTEGKIKEPNLLAEAGQGLLGAGMSYLRGDIGGMMQGVMGLGKSVMGRNSEAAERTKQTRTSPADVIMWSGCKDSQTSADTNEAGRATGAMSYAFIAALNKYPQQSYVQLLNTIRDELKGRYDQKPQLSASHPIDTNILFIC